MKVISKVMDTKHTVEYEGNTITIQVYENISEEEAEKVILTEILYAMMAEKEDAEEIAKRIIEKKVLSISK